MPNIRPISDLINYNEVLKERQNGEPVVLTENGRGKYVVIVIEEYNRQQNSISLITKLNEAEEVIKTGNEWQTLDDLKNSLGYVSDGDESWM